MLKIILVNEVASLNNFFKVESKEYVPGKPMTVKFQIMDSELDIRLIPATNAKVNVTIKKSDNTDLVKAAAMMFNPDDRSLWTVSFTGAETLAMVGANMLVELDFNGSSVLSNLSDSTDLRTGMAYNVLAKITFDGEC